MKSTCCIQCGHGFDYEPITGLPFSLHPTICAGCEQTDKAAETVKESDRRMAFWKSICPPLYQDTDINHRSMPPAAKMAQILNWQYGPQGLVIHGITRKCKTRVAWLLVKRLITEGRSVIALSSGDFARQCAEANAEGADSAEAWHESLLLVNVLFLDDFGKFKLTERVEADLFEIIEARTAHKRPIIITSNFVGTSLVQKLSPDRGPAIVERLREFCIPINL